MGEDDDVSECSKERASAHLLLTHVNQVFVRRRLLQPPNVQVRFGKLFLGHRRAPVRPHCVARIGIT